MVMVVLFYDIGKVSQVFQVKLWNCGKLMVDVYCYEWVLLCLFEVFVGLGSSDEDWLWCLVDK